MNYAGDGRKSDLGFMSFASHVYTASAGQTNFAIPFEYISSDHLSVKINDVETSEWSVSNGDVVLNFGAIAGQLVTVERITPIDIALVTFNGGSTLTSQNLNVSALQAVYSLQELDDTIGETLEYVEALSQTEGNLPPAASANMLAITDGANSWTAISSTALGTLLGVSAAFVPNPTSVAANRFVVTTGSNAYALRTPSEARTSLGLEDLATTAFSALNLSSRASDFRSQLGLGTSAVVDTGTDIGDIPLNTVASALGTAAYKDTGTSAGNVVELVTGGKLPAVDGSLLTNLTTSGTPGTGVVLTGASRIRLAFEEASHGVTGGKWSTGKSWGWFAQDGTGSAIAQWNTQANSIGGGSAITIGTGTVTLEAGDYYTDALVNLSFAKSAVLRVVKSDGTVVYVRGFGDNVDKSSMSALQGIFTLAGTTDIKLEVWAEASTSNLSALGPSFSNGFAGGTGGGMVRREWRIWKLS